MNVAGFHYFHIERTRHMRLVELISSMRWYHLIGTWLGCIVLFYIALLLQRPLLQGVSVVVPYPNSPRALVTALGELWRASPLVVLEGVFFLLVGLLVTAVWLAGRVRPMVAIA